MNCECFPHHDGLTIRKGKKCFRFQSQLAEREHKNSCLHVTKAQGIQKGTSSQEKNKLLCQNHSVLEKSKVVALTRTTTGGGEKVPKHRHGAGVTCVQLLPSNSQFAEANFSATENLSLPMAKKAFCHLNNSGNGGIDTVPSPIQKAPGKTRTYVRRQERPDEASSYAQDGCKLCKIQHKLFQFSTSQCPNTRLQNQINHPSFQILGF